jgi:hypothetical protein
MMTWLGDGSMDDDIIANMRSRVERCRRLARGTTDEQTAATLMLMVEEGEADIARLLAKQAAANEGPQQDGPIILA